MSCHKASKVIGIAYNNAKVIYRIYKNENRIKQTPKYLKRHAKTIKANAAQDKQLKPEEAQEAYQSEMEASIEPQSGPVPSLNGNSISHPNSNEASQIQVQSTSNFETGKPRSYSSEPLPAVQNPPLLTKETLNYCTALNKFGPDAPAQGSFTKTSYAPIEQQRNLLIHPRAVYPMQTQSTQQQTENLTAVQMTVPTPGQF